MVQVKTAAASEADKLSSVIFFNTLLASYNLQNAVVLDMFARNGQITIDAYRDYVGSIEAWELNPAHENELRSKVTIARIGCSYNWVANFAAQKRMQYDMIVIDTPQGMHEDMKGVDHAEHFDALRFAIPLLCEVSVVVLYVNMRPYNAAEVGQHGYDQYENYDFERWMHRRRAFYDHDPRLVPVHVALKAYNRVFEACDRMVTSVVIVPCKSDVPDMPPYAYRLGLQTELRK